jgi:hypothetical protein
MNINRKDVIITVILLIIFAGLICLNYFSYEFSEKRATARIEMHNALEARQQEKINARLATAEHIRLREIARNQDISDIFNYDEVYSGLEKEYLDNIAGISEELEKKVVNIIDIVSIVNKRITAAKEFKESLENIDYIPEPLEDFHDLLLFFLENDISTWQATKSYYNGDYEGDIAEIRRLHSENSLLYRQTEELQKEIYALYELEDLL